MRGVLLLVAMLPGCTEDAPPRTQALVYVDTDAHVPRMMDRLRLRTYVEGRGGLRAQCEGCSREIAVRDASWPISFGVVPEPGTRVFLRATLFLTGRTDTDAAWPETAIDVIREVRFEDGEVLEQLAFLPMDCTGAPPDLEARTSCHDAASRAAPIVTTAPYAGEASRTGTWHAELARGCDGAAAPETGLFDEEICIAGGTYWMGDLRRQGFGPSLDGVPEHAVAVGPFFLDRYEYSVGRWRRLVEVLGFEPAINNPSLHDRIPHCNAYLGGPVDPDRDSRPLNCITAGEAQRVCEAEGKRLPTEAEWEWAAGGRENEFLYPWGHHEPETFCWISQGYGPGSCPAESEDWGTNAAPVNVHPLGATFDGALDMSGNVAEWLADAWQLYTEPCWRPGSYGPNPLCDPNVVEISHGRVIRGGSINEGGPYRYPVASRGGAFPDERAPTTGFRCAR